MNKKIWGALLVLTVVFSGCQQVTDFFTFPAEKKPEITSFTAVTTEGAITGILNQESRMISFMVNNPASLDLVTIEFTFVGKVATPGPGSQWSFHSPLDITIEGDAGEIVHYTVTAGVLGGTHDPALEGTWNVTRNYESFDGNDVKTADVVAEIQLDLHPDGTFFRNRVETFTPIDASPVYVVYVQERGNYRNEEGLLVVKTIEERHSSLPFEEPDLGWWHGPRETGYPYVILGNDLHFDGSTIATGIGTTTGVVGSWSNIRFRADPGMQEYEQGHINIFSDNTYAMEMRKGPDLMNLGTPETRTGTWSQDENGVLTVDDGQKIMTFNVTFVDDRMILTDTKPGSGPYQRVN